MFCRCKWTIFLRLNHTTIPDLMCEYVQQAGETVVWRNHPWRRKRGLEEPEPIKKERGSQGTNTHEEETSQMADDYDYVHEYSNETSLLN